MPEDIVGVKSYSSDAQIEQAFSLHLCAAMPAAAGGYRKTRHAPVYSQKFFVRPSIG
jgi:hypothetical protein